ncbi:MAG: hypothetical protein H6684_01395 [Deltaproteobacteria bacterium]|nr:hypothetical protein [bacterium]MCB9476819.1 hypothetical protein [Deltaproteobacteria bacterium]MCB9487366.1 hypothetical protein [Deltaproteobacteria bacterium]
MYIDENSAGAGRPRVWMTKINGSTYRLLFVLIATWVLFVWIDPRSVAADSPYWSECEQLADKGDWTALSERLAQADTRALQTDYRMNYFAALVSYANGEMHGADLQRDMAIKAATTQNVEDRYIRQMQDRMAGARAESREQSAVPTTSADMPGCVG